MKRRGFFAALLALPALLLARERDSHSLDTTSRPRWRNYTATYKRGIISDVRAWNHCLSDDDIRVLTKPGALYASKE